jgi:phosphocarrier protein
MIETTIPVVNKLGLHARAASKLVKLCGGYASSIKFRTNGQEVDGKSIMGILMLAATQGSSLTLVVDGADEVAAVESIRELFADCFGEGE